MKQRIPAQTIDRAARSILAKFNERPRQPKNVCGKPEDLLLQYLEALLYLRCIELEIGNLDFDVFEFNRCFAELMRQYKKICDNIIMEYMNNRKGV